MNQNVFQKFLTDLGDTSSTASYIACLGIALAVFLLMVYLSMRSGRKELRNDVDELVCSVISDVRRPNRQRWVQDPTDPDGAVEFVYLILGNGEKGEASRHFVWLRFHITKRVSGVGICHVHDATDFQMKYARELRLAFRKRQWTTSIISSVEQPNLDETGTRDWEPETILPGDA